MNASIELIRLIAVILIVFTHTRNELESGIAYLIIEQIPTYGTAILSVISGYLYYKISRHKGNLFQKKIKSLAIPFLIANLSVLALVLIFNYVMGYNALNRLSFDLTLVKEGIFSLNSPPINPPTYFIRDIFIIFSIIALFTQKELKTLFVLVPFALLGTLILRLDVAFLFAVGCLYAKFKDDLDKNMLLGLTVLVCVATGVFFPEYLKLPSAFLIFALLIDLQFKFYDTGRFSYLLHLYHAPVIVISYPLLSMYLNDPLLKILAQIALAIGAVYVLYLITKRFEFLKILSGGR